MVGACWGTALITVIGLLAAAAFGSQYRSVSRAGAAGCVAMTVLDAASLIAVMFAIPEVAWPTILAVAASAARLTFTAPTLRPVLTG